MLLADGLNRGETTYVTIYGRQYPVQSRESSECTHRVAQLVDRRMREVASQQKLAEPTKIAIIAALDIADRLLKHRTGREAAGRQAEQVAARLTMMLDREVGGACEVSESD
ncbi:MAG: cell division protein ZapA [Gemmatimonadota bacterium]|nr:cell division protein ZapA [Gemmatimonadota bacterium]